MARKDKDIPKAAQVRPISIAPIIYRLWGQIRLKHCRDFLTSALSPHQAGGCGGPDATSLLLSFHLEFPKKDFPCVAALDFTKAFDSCDFELSLLVMQHLGVPSRILGLLRNQWQEHFRWITFAGDVHPTPMQGAKGLPHKGPSSPIAMSLVLMLAKRRADALEPETRSLLYLDDRTILAPDAQTLRRALEAWNALYDQYQNMVDAQLHKSHTIEVLGVSLGSGPRQRSPKEIQRASHVSQISAR